MVFESIVAEILNRFLGDYVENLDTSQLQIGIFGGDVALQDLVLKQTALDKLDLPVKTVYGHLGKLVLKIPWRNIYKAPVVASIEQLFLLVVPNQEIKYDAEKEESWHQAAKEAELQRIESAKKIEKEKKEKSADQKKAASSFGEKLIEQIIKNVQVFIRDIHIRYEDRVTNPQRPFSLGFTLHNLSVHSTDEEWKSGIPSETSTMIYKVLDLEGLAVYWNCQAEFFPDATYSTPELLSTFRQTICSKEKTPPGFTYMLGPINSQAKLRINSKPEEDGSNFTIPKILLIFTLEQLAIGISKDQYRDVLELLESVDRMARGVPYRKYRPYVSSYRGNYKLWWKFAYTSILEEEVRRKRRNWNWEHMKEHRDMCRKYAEAYRIKLEKEAKTSVEVLNTLKYCEKLLDVTNLVIIRQRVEMEAERHAAARLQAQKSTGWFGSWWKSSPTEEEDSMSPAALAKKFEAAMTPEEKEKLYRAIDYQENAVPVQYPPTFVEFSASFSLGDLIVEVRDDSYSFPRVLLLDLSGVSISVQTRPAAQALKSVVKIQMVTMFGLDFGTKRSTLLTTKQIEGSTDKLLDILFETNPLDGGCDQRVHIQSSPVEIVYDAVTINKLVDIFKPPAESSAISQLQAAAESRLAEMKEMTATGLQYAIEQHNVLDLNIEFVAPYFILPYGGSLESNSDLLIVDLGSCVMKSIMRDRSTTAKVQHLSSQGKSEEEKLLHMMSQSYDKFEIELKDAQVLIALKGEPWLEALTKEVTSSPMHLLHPTSLLVHLDKCLITDDPRLPKIKIAAQLPNVSFNLSDQRVLHLMALFASIPFPTEEELPTLQETGSRSSSISAIAKLLESTGENRRTSVKRDTNLLDQDIVQAIDLEARFEMKELLVTMFRNVTGKGTGEPDDEAIEKLIEFRVVHLEVDVVQQTFDMTAKLRLGGLAFDLHDRVSGMVRLLDTPMLAGQDEYLLSVNFVSVDRASPELHTRHSSVLQLLTVDMTRVSVRLHQEGLVSLMDYAHFMQNELEQAKEAAACSLEPVSTREATSGKLQTITEDEELQSISAPKPTVVSKRQRASVKVVETVDFKLVAKMHNLEIIVACRQREVLEAALLGVKATVSIKKSYTDIIASLQDMHIYDPNPLSVHNKILSVVGEEALSAHVVMFNLDETVESLDKVDISVEVSMACMRVVFLNWFVSSVLGFLDKFQQAQQRIIDAAYDAAEAARQNVQEAYTKAVRIRLDIDLKAPVVVVPTNSQSMDALLLDFGKLTIKNKFQNLGVQNAAGFAAVLDDMHVGLNDLKLSRVKLDNSTNEVQAESLLLQPITLLIMVKRNLSASWFHNIPDMEIIGRMETVLVTLSQEDFCSVMKVLNGNLSEGKQDAAAPAKLSKQRLSNKFNWSELSLEHRASRASRARPTLIHIEPPLVRTSLKFTFTMENLILDLYTGGSKALEGVVSPMHNPDTGLGRFTLHVLSLKGHMRSDGSLAVSALLVDCLMDDTRQDCEKVLKRLMERKQTEVPEDSSESLSSAMKVFTAAEAPFRSMLDVTYQQKGNDTFVDMRVVGFNLVLSLEFLLKVSAFFTEGMEKASAETGVPAPPIAPSAAPRASIAQSKMSRTSTAQVESKPGMMTINLHIEKPDIILVESMDDIDTNAIILNNEINFKLRMSESHQVITGTVKDLELYSCCYNPKKRKETMAQILRPCTITLAGSTPESKGLHLDLSVTDIRISVSPATIELLSSVQRAISSSGAEEKQKEESETDYSGIWIPKEYEDSDYWFLTTEVGEDIVEALERDRVSLPVEPVPEMENQDQICIASAPSIIITVEAGVGNQTLPMLLLEMCFQGDIRNWSSNMTIDSNLNMQMAYYNSYLALWEPLIEPVEVLRDGKPSHALWELKAEVTMNAAEPVQSPTSSEDIEEIPYQPPAMIIEITSKENLEITVSKTCLEVLSNLGKAFQSAVSGQLLPRSEARAPYTVRNDTGLTVTLMLEGGPFQLADSMELGYRQALLENGARVGLCLKDGEALPELGGKLILERTFSTTSIGSVPSDGTQSSSTERLLSIKIRVLDRDCILKLPVARADKRYFPLNHRGEGKDQWGLVSEVTVEEGGTVIILRSIIQIHNHFSEPVEVYYMTRRGNEVERVGIVDKDKSLNLPLYAVYTLTNELFFSVKGYTVSVVPFIWKELQNLLTASKMLQCEPKDKKERDPFYMKIVGEMEQVYFERTNRHTMASVCYNVHLRPAVVLKNFLPVEVVFCLAGTARDTTLGPGLRTQVATAEPGNSTLIIRIPEYLEKEWMCKHEILATPPELSVWTFDSYDSVQKMSMDLGMHTVMKNGSIIMALYCPFWMLNKTGMMLSYRKSRKTEKNESSGSPLKQSDESTNVLYHPDNFKGPILFSFRAKSFFGKKKASIKVEDGEWSDKFSLDVAGSSGVVNCKYGDMVYQIGVHIQLTYSGLTKQVTFIPYYALLNETMFLVECHEADSDDPWTKVKPGECAAFWPRSVGNNDRKLILRIPGQSGVTAPFSIADVHTTLLKLKNKSGGVSVDVQITEGAVYIKFTRYEPGLAPALIINHTLQPITFTEKDCKNTVKLEPHHQIMFTWENPVGSKELQWTSSKKKEYSDDLRKDTIDKMQLADGTEVWWVSFLDGLQRVLLFTADLAVATACQAAGELEPFDQEIRVSIHGVGISFVNNLIPVEVMYIGIASSGIIWETCKPGSRRFKPMSIQEGASIEQAYQRYLQELEIGLATPTSHRTIIDGKLEVDFKAEEVIRPKRSHLRRTYHTGLWLQRKTSPHQIQLHAKVNRLQIDNQMFDCMFPVVLAPVPPPKSIAIANAQKPFAEVSIVQRIMEHSPVQQFKYFKVLIQEFHVKVDMGFLNGVMQLFMADEISDVQEAEQFAEDLKLVDEPLQSHVSVQSSQEQKNFYDLLHFSPLKIHLSFSLSGGEHNQQAETPLFISVLLQSLGVTLTDMQDVVFKLAFFERQYTFLTQRQLISEATSHYVGQSLKQLYVLVLGLDVLGNPYGLVVGLTQGVEAFFYEPIQGAIQGPGEFAEGLVLGVRSLFGHTVGGAAGAVSRITGAMGKGIAALTFDKEYQRKRREALHQRAPNVQTGLAQSGKGLVMGVVDGVTGVFTKPISGAREEGVEGFFKGVGKGMVGLVTRPTAGVIDFASGSFDAVKRATELGDEVVRLRPPRFLQPDGLVRPYVRSEAEGNKLLQEVDKNKYASTDTYVAHLAILKDFLLLTDKRIMYIVHNDIFGGWQVDWSHTWDTLCPPRLLDKGVFIATSEGKKKVLGLFGSGETGKMLLVKDPEQRQWLVTKMNELMKK